MSKKPDYGSLLRSNRERLGLTQQTIADKLQISRASYIALEQNKRELSFGEAVAIANLYQLSLDALAQRLIPDTERYLDMIRVFLRAGARDKKTLKKTKLAQLLYLADVSWFYSHNESLSHMSYRKYPFGPMADSFLHLIESLEAEGYVSVTQVTRDNYHMYELTETRGGARKGVTHLTPAMQKHLEQIWAAWSEASTAEILAFTTEQQPYTVALADDLLDLKLIKTEPPHLVS